MHQGVLCHAIAYFGKQITQHVRYISLYFYFAAIYFVHRFFVNPGSCMLFEFKNLKLHSHGKRTSATSWLWCNFRIFFWIFGERGFIPTQRHLERTNMVNSLFMTGGEIWLGFWARSDMRSEDGVHFSIFELINVIVNVSPCPAPHPSNFTNCTCMCGDGADPSVALKYHQHSSTLCKLTRNQHISSTLAHGGRRNDTSAFTWIRL